MPGEAELQQRGEDANPRVASLLGGIDEDSLGEVQLAGQGLQLRLWDLARVREDGQLIAGERPVGEDVGDDKAEGRHAATVRAS
jgi:hypothetical protein